MSEVDVLRAEVAELREAVLQLAHAQSQARDCMLQVLPAEFVVKNPDQIYSAIGSAFYALNTSAKTQPEYEKADWMKRLERRTNMSFTAWRTLKYVPMVEASRKASD